jgi:hypothetical protein
MTEQPGLPDQFKELATENEKRMKAIQDQIANQLEAQRKAVADLVESQQKAFADFLEQQRSVKITDHWEAQRKASTAIGGGTVGWPRAPTGHAERPFRCGAVLSGYRQRRSG